jgi:hypothetical protein
MEIFPLVYRCAVVIKPKQPMLDWLNFIDPSHKPSLQEIQKDSHAYLAPDYEEASDLEKAIDKYLKATMRASSSINSLPGIPITKE